jgi:Flp pilus assembly protein TadG
MRRLRACLMRTFPIRTLLIRGRGRDERGALTPAVMVMALGFLLLGGLVVDGGRQLTAKLRAEETAREAARAGAIYIDQRQSGAHIDHALATEAVDRYCEEARSHDDTIKECRVTGFTKDEKVGDDGIGRAFEYVDVEVQIEVPTSLFGIIGVSSFTSTMTENAAAVQAIVDPFNDPLNPSWSVHYPTQTVNPPTTSGEATLQPTVPSQYQTTVCGQPTTLPLTVGVSCTVTTSTHTPPPPPATTKTQTSYSTYPTSVPPTYPPP